MAGEGKEGESVSTERIKCPVCNLEQDAEVELTIPWLTYIHECPCGYVITESDWDTVPEVTE